MVMVRVPAGEFEMGSTFGGDTEQPVHSVSLEAFWIDRTEVTHGMYGSCVEADACEAPRCARAVTPGDDDPATCITWADAQGYCTWAGSQLPTEAQWEYAARGPQDYLFPWGDASPTCDQAQFAECDGEALPVGSLPAGASWCGALDLAGNVSEWVADWYSDDYYARSPAVEPTGPMSGTDRVTRGASWIYGPLLVRGTYRLWHDPSDWRFDLGFRCAREAD
jgi:formylglycine-generating enzyme required for sulfatase activity